MLLIARLHKILNYYKQALLIIIGVSLILGCLFVAMVLRFNGNIPAVYANKWLLISLVYIFVKMPYTMLINHKIKLRFRYKSGAVSTLILGSVLCSLVLWGINMLYYSMYGINLYPNSVLLIDLFAFTNIVMLWYAVDILLGNISEQGTTDKKGGLKGFIYIINAVGYYIFRENRWFEKLYYR